MSAFNIAIVAPRMWERSPRVSPAEVDHRWPSAAEPQPKKRSRHERPKRRCRRLRGRSWATDGTRIKRKKKETLMPLEKEEITEQIPRRCRWRLAASPGRSLLGIRVPSVFRLKILSKMRDFFL